MSRSRPEPAGPAVDRRAVLLGAFGLTATAVAGCGGSGSGAAGGSGGPAGQGFPVTVSGEPGPVTVPRTPKRVVTAGYLRDTDLAVALGADLVGIVKSGNFPSGLAPWQHPQGKPALLEAQGGMPLEKIAALHPDLILAADDYTLVKDYDKLKAIAPTLGYRKAFGQDTWQVMAGRAGRVLGRADRASRLVRRTEALIAETKKDHPEFAGRTFTFGPVIGGKLYTTSGTDDTTVSFFSQIGFTLSPKVRGLKTAGTSGRAEVSLENLDVIDADVVILSYASPGDRTKFEANPLFKKLSAVRRGSYVVLDLPAALAVAFPSVVSLPWGLRRVVPELVPAARKAS